MASACTMRTSSANPAAATFSTAAAAASSWRSSPWIGTRRRTLAGAGLAAEIRERPRRLGAHVRPPFDRERARETRRAPPGDQPGLDRERTRAAHRIEERLVTRVARRPQNRGRQRLLERRHDRAHPVAATVQRLAAEIERERELRLGEVRHHAKDGTARVDVGPRTELGPQAVRDGVLDLQADESRMVVLALPERRLDHERRLGRQMLLPGHARRRLVEPLGTLRHEVAEGIEHPHGDAGPEADAERFVQVRGEAHPPRS